MTDIHEPARAIAKACLNHVPFDGWTEETLAMAASESGFNSHDWQVYLSAGVIDAILLNGQMADEDMTAAFHALETAPEKTHLKIRELIMIRLHQGRPHKEAIAKTVSYLSQPRHAGAASKSLYATVDAMWRAAGDEATDFSFYSKRATLAGVYSATLLCFLGDDSPNLEKTEAFLDRRLKDVAQIPKFTAPAKAAVGRLSSLASSLAAGVRRPF